MPRSQFLSIPHLRKRSQAPSQLHPCCLYRGCRLYKVRPTHCCLWNLLLPLRQTCVEYVVQSTKKSRRLTKVLLPSFRKQASTASTLSIIPIPYFSHPVRLGTKHLYEFITAPRPQKTVGYPLVLSK